MIAGMVDGETRGAGESLSGKLRVCILIPKLQIGGAEIQVLHLLRNLDAARFSTHLCCFTRGDPGLEREAGRWVESVSWIDLHLRTLPFDMARLVRYLRRGRFQVLHCHLPLADSLGRLAGWLAGVPVLMTTEHGRNLWKSKVYLIFERLLNRLTDMRICVSEDIMDIRRKREGTPLEKLELVPNAVDPETFAGPGRGRAAVMAEFGWDPSDPLVLSVGRLVKEKDYPLLVDAVSIMLDRHPGIRCLLVGEGDRRQEISDRIGSLGLAGHVRIAGARSDIPDLLGAADVFVLSSIREGLPVSLLEAMAAGRGIAATSVGGIPDAVREGENGLLVPPGDSAALAHAAGKLLGDRDLRLRLGAAAREEVEKRFSIKRTAGRVGEIYSELYGRKKKWTAA